MPEPLKFRPEDFTVGDLEDFEEITGQPLAELIATFEKAEGATVLPPAKVLKALVFLVKRSTNPEFRIEDARNVKVGEIIMDYSPVDPTTAASSGSEPPSATSGA
jgi:hypothetical protein